MDRAIIGGGCPSLKLTASSRQALAQVIDSNFKSKLAKHPSQEDKHHA
jgi:hypothetical protein